MAQKRLADAPLASGSRGALVFRYLHGIFSECRKNLRFIATLRTHLAQKHGANAGHEDFNKPGNKSRRHGMGDVINFRKAHKAAGRSLRQCRAASDRWGYGRNKAERKLGAARDAKALPELDLHWVDTGDER